MKLREQQQQQQNGNNGDNNNNNNSSSGMQQMIANSLLVDGDALDNVSPNDVHPSNIYLHGSSAQLIMASGTNSLSRNSNNYNLYEIRKSKRGGMGAAQHLNYNNGTIKTATYVSPNGTLSKVNIYI